MLWGIPHGAGARARIDARVDALSRAELLTHQASSLVDPLRQRRARTLADYRHLASTGWALAQIAALWWFWRSGAAARLRDAMRRRSRSRFPQRAVFGAALGLLAALAALPFAFAGYRIGFTSALSGEPVAAWFAGYALRTLADAAIGAVLVTIVLWLVEHVRAWYLIVAAMLYAGALGAVALEPVLPGGTAQKTTPHVVADAGRRIAGRLGMAPPPVLIVATSRRSRAISLRATGIGPTARVLLADNDLVHFTNAEIDAVLAEGEARVAGHVPLRQTAFAVTLLVLSAALAVLCADRVGFRRDDDALSRLALVATFLGIVALVTYPVYNAYARNEQRGIDGRVADVTGDRASLVRALVRAADVNLIPLCDRRSVRWYFEERPTLGGRIARAAGSADPCGG